MGNCDITMQHFREIVRFAYNKSPFYRRLYDDFCIDVESCMLPDDLPIIIPENLVQDSLEMKSNIPLYRVCASSGTKHKPKLLFRSQADFYTSVRNQIQLMEWCGLTREDIVGIVQPSGLWGYADLTQEAARQMNILTIQLGNAEDDMALNLIENIGVTVLDIAPSRLYSLLNLAEKRGYNLHNVRIAMCSGEKLSSELRQYAWTLFQIKLFNQYGSEETDALGGEREPGSGIVLLKDSFLYEIRKKDGQYAGNGENGSLIVTSLYHQGTPLIRYQIDDNVRILSREEGIVEILGRNQDYIVLYDSVKLHVSQIQRIMNDFLSEPNAWQVRVQTFDGKILILICINEDMEEGRRGMLLNELPKTSIDIYELWRSGMVLFRISCEGIIRTGRGKQIHLIDERNRKELPV